MTRYLCISKSQGRPEHVIQQILILNEKEFPPEGFSVVQQTTDTNTKAFKKKQLCFKQTHFRYIAYASTSKYLYILIYFGCIISETMSNLWLML